MNFKTQSRIFLLLITITLTACSEGEGIAIKDPWARPALKDGNSAAYMVIENHTGSDEVLLSASTEAASAVELHDVLMSGDDSTMQMVKQENIQIPAGETVTFQPGSLHTMLIGLQTDLVEGDTLTLTLVFRNSGEITIEMPIEQR
jgi:copper(I)-binding protein